MRLLILFGLLLSLAGTLHTQTARAIYRCSGCPLQEVLANQEDRFDISFA